MIIKFLKKKRLCLFEIAMSKLILKYDIYFRCGYHSDMKPFQPQPQLRKILAEYFFVE